MTSIERYYRPLFTDAGSESAVNVHEYGSAWTLISSKRTDKGSGTLAYSNTGATDADL